MDASAYSANDSWLKAEDLKGTTQTLKIAGVEGVTFGEDDPGKHKLGIYFAGREKGIISNKTNTKRIIETFGAETDNWIGKELRISQNHTPLGVGFTLMPVPAAESAKDFDDEIPF